MSDVKMHPILGDVKRYPAPCGCAGPKYVSMCDAHKDMEIERCQRMNGMTATSLELDAKRYRWLRERQVTIEKSVASGEIIVLRLTGVRLDTAVDQERAK
jgi:hypothetical protein